MSFQGGVYPVYYIIFKIGTKGVASSDSDMKIIKDMDNFGFKIDGKSDSWTPMDTAGWLRQMMTGKSFAISLKGKRNVGDPGNDYIAITAWADGLNCSSRAEIVFPDGAKLTFNCIVDVSNPGGDDSTKVAPLEFELKSDGKPIYTPGAAPAALSQTSVPANNATTVATGVKPAITFSNAITDFSGVMLFNVTDNVSVAFTGALDGTNKILTITPTVALVTAKKYDIFLVNVTDIYGQELANTVISFTVA